jgi:hypothetical protein
VAGGSDHRPPLRPITTATDPALDSDQAFTFAVMGETRPPVPGMPFPAVSHAVMDELSLIRPAFVLCTGDIIWGFQDTPQEMLNELDRFRALADRAGVPLYNVPGNHELQSNPMALEVLERWGHDLYGSFDVGRNHFVALNTEEINREGRVTGEQLEWLESDLTEHGDAATVFVFMHRPLFSWFQGDFNPDDGEILTRLFRDHSVKAVFSAHDHFFYEEVHDGVRYLTVGGAGAPAYTQPHGGGFSHYLLVTVGGGEPDVTVVEPNRLEVVHVAGNDGLQPCSTARVVNTTDRDLTMRNIGFRLPRLSSNDGYSVSVDFMDFKRDRVELEARIRAVEDRGDGSVTVAVALTLPTGTGSWVTVDAREPEANRARAAPS